VWSSKSFRRANFAGMVWIVAPIGPDGPAPAAVVVEPGTAPVVAWSPLFCAGAVPWPADGAPSSGIISAARASSCAGCWSCGSGGPALQGCAAWPGLSWPVSGTKPGLVVDDGFSAGAVVMNIAVAAARAAVAAMSVWPFMAISLFRNNGQRPYQVA